MHHKCFHRLKVSVTVRRPIPVQREVLNKRQEPLRVVKEKTHPGDTVFTLHTVNTPLMHPCRSGHSMLPRISRKFDRKAWNLSSTSNKRMHTHTYTHTRAHARTHMHTHTLTHTHKLWWDYSSHSQLTQDETTSHRERITSCTFHTQASLANNTQVWSSFTISQAGSSPQLSNRQYCYLQIHREFHLKQLSHRESSPAAFTQGKSSLAAFTQEGSTLADFSHRKDHL